MVDVAVITLTRNRPDYVERLTSGLDAQEGAPPTERILVNNGAPRERSDWDPVTKYAARHGWKVIEPGRNTSYSEGNNFAARATSAPWLWLLNDDVILHPDTLARLCEVRSRAQVIGTALLNGDGTLNHGGAAVLPMPHHVLRGKDLDSLHLADSLRQEAVTFASALVSHDLWTTLGGLDERYWYCYEDTDFCVRALEAGATIRCSYLARATHDECGTRTRGGQNEVLGLQLFREAHAARLPGILRRYWGT
jgi:GT2 family glycosyltransferase